MANMVAQHMHASLKTECSTCCDWMNNFKTQTALPVPWLCFHPKLCGYRKINNGWKGFTMRGIGIKPLIPHQFPAKHASGRTYTERPLFLTHVWPGTDVESMALC